MALLRSAALSIGFAVSLAACASVENPDFSSGQSIIEADKKSILSSNSFDETSERIRIAIESRGLTIFAVVDHAAGAREASLVLPENTLFVFGSPRAGTPLMAENPKLGLDLPLKISVYIEDDDVYVLSSDIRAITARAGVNEQVPVVDKIESVLVGIVKEAVSN